MEDNKLNISKENYDLIIQKIDEFDTKLKSMEGKFTDIQEFNKTLLDRRINDNSNNDEAESSSKLLKKLKENIYGRNSN